MIDVGLHKNYSNSVRFKENEPKLGKVVAECNFLSALSEISNNSNY